MSITTQLTANFNESQGIGYSTQGILSKEWEMIYLTIMAFVTSLNKYQKQYAKNQTIAKYCNCIPGKG